MIKIGCVTFSMSLVPFVGQIKFYNWLRKWLILEQYDGNKILEIIRGIKQFFMVGECEI